jgi:hypothetical protein
MFTPPIGAVRWSNFFGAYVTLQRYSHDNEWYFKLVLPSPYLTAAAKALPDLTGTYRAQTAWSQMPLKKE